MWKASGWLEAGQVLMTMGLAPAGLEEKSSWCFCVIPSRLKDWPSWSSITCIPPIDTKWQMLNQCSLIHRGPDRDLDDSWYLWFVEKSRRSGAQFKWPDSLLAVTVYVNKCLVCDHFLCACVCVRERERERERERDKERQGQPDHFQIFPYFDVMLGEGRQMCSQIYSPKLTKPGNRTNSWRVWKHSSDWAEGIPNQTCILP